MGIYNNAMQNISVFYSVFVYGLQYFSLQNTKYPEFLPVVICYH